MIVEMNRNVNNKCKNVAIGWASTCYVKFFSNAVLLPFLRSYYNLDACVVCGILINGVRIVQRESW